MADDPFRNPEERAKWTTLAQERAETVKKLKVERARVRRQLEALQHRMAHTAGSEQAYLKAQARVLQSFLRQVELQDVDNAVCQIPDAQTLAAIEWESLESTSCLLRMGLLVFERIAMTVEADLAAALAGEPAPDALPEAWRQVRASLPTRHDLVEALKQLAVDYRAYEEAAAPALEAFEAIARLGHSPERLTAAKGVGLPALKGQQYRIEASFRKLPGGEAFLYGMRYETPEPAEAAATVPRKRSLTDQMLGFLKRS